MKTPFRIDVWVTEEIADAVREVADAQMITESAIGRQALAFYLGSIGALKPRANGQHKPTPQQQEMTDG